METIRRRIIEVDVHRSLSTEIRSSAFIYRGQLATIDGSSRGGSLPVRPVPRPNRFDREPFNRNDRRFPPPFSKIPPHNFPNVFDIPSRETIKKKKKKNSFRRASRKYGSDDISPTDERGIHRGGRGNGTRHSTEEEKIRKDPTRGIRRHSNGSTRKVELRSITFDKSSVQGFVRVVTSLLVESRIIGTGEVIRGRDTRDDTVLLFVSFREHREHDPISMGGLLSERIDRRPRTTPRAPQVFATLPPLNTNPIRKYREFSSGNQVFSSRERGHDSPRGIQNFSRNVLCENAAPVSFPRTTSYRR